MLFLYAIAFSYSYLAMDAGFGTLLLFGIVQVVMILSSLYYKEKITSIQAIGIIISILGLVYMLYPKGNFEVSLFHAFLMIISGFAWATYSVLGKKSTDALKNTTDNFIKATLFIAISYFIVDLDSIYFNSEGLVLAIISGAITSALGYIIWYQVLPNISIVTASVVQLFVPIVAILLSVVFLEELLTLNLIISTIIVLAGILITVVSTKKSF